VLNAEFVEVQWAIARAGAQDEEDRHEEPAVACAILNTGMVGDGGNK
jgi:hypothetical protein